MNTAHIYLKLNAVTNIYELYINGVRTNSLYKAASLALGIVTPLAFLESMKDKMQKHVLATPKSYCQDLMFYSATQTQYEKWAKERNILPWEPCEVVIQGISEDGKSIVAFEYVQDEAVHEAILESERLPIPTQADWICN